VPANAGWNSHIPEPDYDDEPEDDEPVEEKPPCPHCDNGWLVTHGGLLTKAMRCPWCYKGEG